LWRELVPRYFFHTRDGGGLSLDDEGSELCSLDAARDEAIASAKLLISQALLKGIPLSEAIARSYEVSDGVRQVFSVTFAEAADAPDHRP
jgi:hypothetical protein